MKLSDGLLLLLRAIICGFLAIFSAKLNWLNQCLIVSLIYFFVTYVSIRNFYSISAKIIGGLILIFPFTAIYIKNSITEKSVYTYPIWVMAIISCLIAIFFSLIKKNKVKGIFLSSYLTIAVLIAYVGYPNYLTAVIYPKPYVNEILPPIVFENEDGTKFDLMSLKGKVILLDFWSTSCVPCFKKFPELEKLYSYYRTTDKDVMIFAVNLPYPNDQPNSAREMISKFKYGFPKLYTSDSEAWKKLNIMAVPTLLILDRNLNVRYRGGLITEWNQIFQNTKKIVSNIKKNS